MVEGQDTGSGVSKNGDHSRRMAAIRFYLLSRRQFSAHPKSSLTRIDKRTARAARNTRYHYNQNSPLDHKMADNCVSLARTNTVSSTITKPKLNIVQELCESRGGRPGLSVLTNLLVSVDVKIYCTVLRHWSQLVPNMSTDI